MCHLRAEAGPGGLHVTWVRRTRVEGDGWTPAEVPLGEDREAYLVRVGRGGAVLRARGPAVVALAGGVADATVEGEAGTASPAHGTPFALDDGDARVFRRTTTAPVRSIKGTTATDRWHLVS